MPATVAGQGGGAVLDGVLERVTFANPETGYTIARIAPERGGAELVTAVGPLLGAKVGEFLRLRGRWSRHPKYGRQFEVHSYATVLPATAAGIQKYLGSGLIKGIGPVMAERMVAHFGSFSSHFLFPYADPGPAVSRRAGSSAGRAPQPRPGRAEASRCRGHTVAGLAGAVSPSRFTTSTTPSMSQIMCNTSRRSSWWRRSAGTVPVRVTTP